MMNRMLRELALLAILGRAAAANAAEVVEVRPWELHSSFWMSLHQTLIADAMRSTPRPLPTLSADEQTAWNEAVGAYRTAGGRDMSVTRPMMITSDALTQVADDATDLKSDAPLKDALSRAAPVYRKHWWAADDQANRFFIAYAAAMLRDAGARLVRDHEKVYRTPWPERVRVYISPYAGALGAYTMVGLSGGVITTMSSRDSGYQGMRAVEMLLHESSHAVVSPDSGTVGTAIAVAARKRGVEPPRNLWHAILFATSGELARRLLAERGVANYAPMSSELLMRAWSTFREPIEKHWFAYLDGQGTLEEAIDRVVSAVPR